MGEVIFTDFFGTKVIIYHGKFLLGYLKYFLIFNSDRLFSIVRELDPDRVQRRKRDIYRGRGQYMVPGPNFVWSNDGHDKFSFWGIQIYAAIDAFSRYIIWCCIGISNRPQQ